MRSPGGARLNKCIFVLVNAWLVVGWAWQLMQEAREEREWRIAVLKEEIRVWDKEIERLEGLLEVSLYSEEKRRKEWEFCGIMETLLTCHRRSRSRSSC